MACGALPALWEIRPRCADHERGTHWVERTRSSGSRALVRRPSALRALRPLRASFCGGLFSSSPDDSTGNSQKVSSRGGGGGGSAAIAFLCFGLLRRLAIVT
jgi:hypothetical protein